MPFRIRPHFEDRQIVQYSGETITLSGFTKAGHTGMLVIEPTVLDFTGSTSGASTTTINGLTGYLNGSRFSGLKVYPPVLKLSGGTGTTTVDVTGYVLKAFDADGTVYWDASSTVSADTNTYVDSASINCGTNILQLTRNDAVNVDVDLSCLTFTGNTSGDCITDIYVSNIHSCSPLNINPLDEGSVYFGSTSAVTVDLSNDRLGVGTISPASKLTVKGDGTGSTVNTLLQDSLGNNLLDIRDSGRILINQSNKSLGVAGDNLFTIRGSSDADLFQVDSLQDYVGIGKNPLDGSGISAKLHIKSDTSSSTDDAFYIENSSSSPLFIIQDNGYIGAGFSSPTATLHIQGEGSTDTTEPFIVENSSATPIIYTDNSGDVGIGTNSVTKVFTVKTSTNDDGIVLHNGSDNIRAALYYQSATDSTDFILYDGSQIRTRFRADTSDDSYIHGTLLIDNNLAATTVQSGYQIDFRGRTKLASHTGAQNCRIIGAGGDANLDIIGNNPAVTGNTRAYRFASEDIASLNNREARLVLRGYNDDDGSASEILPTTGRANYIYIQPRGHTNGSIFDVITVNPSKADIDFNIMGDTKDNLFYLDASTDSIGIYTPAPTATLQLGDATGDTATFRYIDGNQSDGYVLTTDTDGNATWKEPTTFTGNTSGSCITDLYVTNIHGCSPVNVQTDLEIKGTHTLLSDSSTLADNWSTLTSLFNGQIINYDTDSSNALILSNNNPSGSTGMFFGNLDGYPSTRRTGFLSYYGTAHTRGGTPNVGTGFFRNKVVLQSQSDADGLVISPGIGDVNATLWFEINGNSVGIVDTDKGNWGFGLNSDGTEMPNATVQIGSSGSTATMVYHPTNVPATSGDTGNVGEMSWDDTYFYIRTNTGWGRVALDYAF